MKINLVTGQLKGPFKANQELIEKIKEDSAIDSLYVKHLGVQTDIGYYIYINNQEFEIGKTGIYEIGNTEILSLFFKQDTDENSIIDYTIESV